MRRFRWYHPRAIWRSIALQPRVYMGAAAWAAAQLLLPASLPSAQREAAAWCVGGFVYLILAFRDMKRCPLELIKERAARQDESGIVILVLILLAVVSSIVAIAGLLHEAKTASDNARMLYVLITAMTIFISWSVMQVLFALHYAHEHYAPHNEAPDGISSLDFPKDAHPDYWDFLYFATSIGAASQTADVAINSKRMRRLVTLHAIVSFFFNTMVLALTVNLAASLI